MKDLGASQPRSIRSSLLVGWRNALEKHPSELAVLRASKSLDENFSLEMTKKLAECEGLANLEEHTCGALAGLLANIDTNDPDTHFICSVGGTSRRGRRPALSEVHFERLCSEAPLEQIYTRFRRAILVLGRRASITSVAECLISWQKSSEEDTYSLPGEILDSWKRKYGNLS